MFSSLTVAFRYSYRKGKAMADALMNGKFSLYETPDGGYHIAYVVEGDEETRHIGIPPMIVRMAKQGMEGNLSPMQMLKGMMGNGKN